MLVARYIPFLLLCAVALADTASSTTTDKFEERLKSIDEKLNVLISHIVAVDTKLEQIKAGRREGSSENGTVGSSQQAQNELQTSLSNQLATLSASSEKRIENLECKIHEQFKLITEYSKRALLDALHAPNHECLPDWTVFQRRSDGSVNFYRNWTEYQRGFGNREGEFWLGLDQLSAMLATGRHVLRVQLEAYNGKVAYALYDDFRLGNASELYRLKSIGNYSGTAGDSLTPHVGQSFSTFDADNDSNKISHCARIYSGAWWYENCCVSNLNSKYKKGDNTLYWLSFQGEKSLKSTTMMIRPHSTSSFRNIG